MISNCPSNKTKIANKPKDTNLFTQISYKIATKCEKENKDNTFDTDQLSLNILNSKP